MSSAIWICGNRTPNYIQKNSKYTFFDPFKSIEGDNINHLNRFWSEYVCQYYVWKNNKKSDIVTFCHDNKIIKTQCIDIDNIDTNKIQYYSCVQIDMSKDKDIFGNTIEKKENLTNIQFRNIYYEIVEKMHQPMFMYDDLTEYLNTQKVLSLESIESIANDDNYLFCNLEMYSCVWSDFVKLQELLFSYFEFIESKYKFNRDPHKYKDFFRSIIVPHYQQLIVDSEQNNEKLSISAMLYQISERFMTVLEESTDYGFDRRNNIYRLFSYMIEILISLFIRTKDSFYNKQYRVPILFIN